MLLSDVAAWGTRVEEGDETFMIALFAKTWFLWWLLASVVVLRWFHGVIVVDPRDTQDPPKRDKSEHTIPSQLASRA